MMNFAQTELIELVAQLGEEPRAERADASENRARILATAEALFAEFGVAAVNMVDIARRAGVGQGTLYRRFANKGELCLTLLDTQMREFQEQTLTQLRTMMAANEPMLAQLAWFIEAWIAFQTRHSPLLCAVSQEMAIESSPHSPPFLWQRRTVHGLLDAAAQRGELAPAVDVPFTADALLALLQPDILVAQQQQGGHTPERISAGIQRLLQGLRA
jgi:AcrR family transcriptional regulator